MPVQWTRVRFSPFFHKKGRRWEEAPLIRREHCAYHKGALLFFISPDTIIAQLINLNLVNLRLGPSRMEPSGFLIVSSRRAHTFLSFSATVTFHGYSPTMERFSGTTLGRSPLRSKAKSGVSIRRWATSDRGRPPHRARLRPDPKMVSSGASHTVSASVLSENFHRIDEKVLWSRRRCNRLLRYPASRCIFRRPLFSADASRDGALPVLG